MLHAEIVSTPTLTRRCLEVYRSLFVGRSDDFALQQADGRYRRAGRPLSNDVLYQHLTGEHTIGTYVMDRAGRCTFAVFDADQEDGLDQLQAVQAHLAHDGMSSTLEKSRRGGHLWVVLQEPVPASRLRTWLLPYCPPGIEFYPKQNEGCGYGSLIRLPLGMHRLTERWYPFVRYDVQSRRFVPLAPTFFFLMNELETLIVRTPVPALDQHVQRNQPRPAITHQSLAKTPLTCLSYSPNTIHAWCAMQDPFEVIRRYVIVHPNGLACCPFGEHHRNGKDTHPSFKVYQPKRVGGSCWYCYTAQEGGNVFDFLCRWYGVNAREMWRRIQTGEQM